MCYFFLTFVWYVYFVPCKDRIKIKASGTSFFVLSNVVGRGRPEAQNSMVQTLLSEKLKNQESNFRKNKNLKSEIQKSKKKKEKNCCVDAYIRVRACAWERKMGF